MSVYLNRVCLLWFWNLTNDFSWNNENGRNFGYVMSLTSNSSKSQNSTNSFFLEKILNFEGISVKIVQMKQKLCFIQCNTLVYIMHSSLLTSKYYLCTKFRFVCRKKKAPPGLPPSHCMLGLGLKPSFLLNKLIIVSATPDLRITKFTKIGLSFWNYFYISSHQLLLVNDFWLCVFIV